MRRREGGCWRAILRGAGAGLVICSFSVAAQAQSDAAPAAAPDGSAQVPRRLTITVVGDRAALGTFEHRVSSWFSDGTEVSVVVADTVDQEQLLASSPAEVRAFIVPLSAERALLTFSLVAPPAPPRHLVREVRLREGFDELGLERLASVTHSAFVALSEGSEGVEREQAERDLGAAVVAARGPTPASQPPAPVTPVPRPLPRSPPLAPKSATETLHGPATREAAPPPRQLVLVAGYGVRLRGGEGIGQGPRLALGVQARGPRAAISLQLSGHYLFRSRFEAEPFRASVQTTALRFQLGIERQLRASLALQGLLGLGVDVARIAASVASSIDASPRARPRSEGTQWRAGGELGFGALRRGELFDIGIFVYAHFAFEDVRYNAATQEGDVLLVRPWLVQPALSIEGRFRSAL
jgi:hypothetical protein